MAEKMATRAAYGKALVEMGAENPNLVVMDADLSKSTMTAEFGKNLSGTVFQYGYCGTEPLRHSGRSGIVRKDSLRIDFRNVCQWKGL